MTDAFVYSPPGAPWPKILYQDKDVVVIEKPSGLLSNPGRGTALQDSVQLRLEQHFDGLYLIHRLDMATSGLMVFARRRKAEVHLKQQFASRQVEKTYLARVSGVPVLPAGLIDLPLAPDLAGAATAAPRNKVCFNSGKPAQTYYRVLCQEQNSAVLQLKPITGRSHQLRVHLASLGHAILGDAIYATAQAQQAAPCLLLHATQLAFDQPYSGERLSFYCPPNLQDFGLDQLPELYSTAQMLEPSCTV